MKFTLLACGVIAGPLFLVIALIHGMIRERLDLTGEISDRAVQGQVRSEEGAVGNDRSAGDRDPGMGRLVQSPADYIARSGNPPVEYEHLDYVHN
jgi:hypothetical protein